MPPEIASIAILVDRQALPRSLRDGEPITRQAIEGQRSLADAGLIPLDQRKTALPGRKMVGEGAERHAGRAEDEHGGIALIRAAIGYPVISAVQGEDDDVVDGVVHLLLLGFETGRLGSAASKRTPPPEVPGEGVNMAS